LTEILEKFGGSKISREKSRKFDDFLGKFEKIIWHHWQERRKVRKKGPVPVVCLSVTG
jgi:hypothetical protein